MRGAVIANLPELSVFGESALFGGEHATRNATVSAQGGQLVKVLLLQRGNGRGWCVLWIQRGTGMCYNASEQCETGGKR